MERYLDDTQFFDVTVRTPGGRILIHRLADPTELDLDRAWDGIKDEMRKMGYLRGR